MVVWTELAAGVCWFVYACFFEWTLHRHIMHRPRVPLQDAFRGHMEHHKTFRGEEFQTHEEGLAHGVTLRWYAFPLIILGHLPFFLAFQALTGLPTVWGAVGACVLYFAGYEYTHYLMHVPRGHFVERFGWFRFIREHHRLHHQHARYNYNVFIPLADACLGTLITKPPVSRRQKNSS
ncbi:MAG: sterol desaturase family protein [Actinomycetota bacterium]